MDQIGTTGADLAVQDDLLLPERTPSYASQHQARIIPAGLLQEAPQAALYLCQSRAPSLVDSCLMALVRGWRGFHVTT